MDRKIFQAKFFKGEISIPGDKSISHRAVMFSAIANGTSTIHGFLNAADPRSTMNCFSEMGITLLIENDKIIIHGKGLHGLHSPNRTLDAGNSGTTIRLISGILAGQKFQSTITGDEYLVKRPMKRIIDPLTAMGAKLGSTERLTAPLTFYPVQHLKAIEYELPIASAQVKSAVLLAGLYADGITTIIEKESSRDHTERMLGLKKESIDGKTRISIEAGTNIPCRNFVVPGDPSSSAFFAVAGLLVPNSEILIKNVGLNPSRIGFLAVLKKMGGKIQVINEKENGGEPIGDLVVQSSTLTTNFILEGDIIPNIIDEIPILSVAAAFAEGSFEIRNAEDLRNKETDRINAICTNLNSMGVNSEEFQDGFAFHTKNKLHSSKFQSYGDHRIAMAFGIAASVLQGESTIHESECVDISFPTFWETLDSLQC
jgi:3-phosphoshikimate 1-carboxyvinyltransferase